jgi:electron transfer flavoprotein alpha subunit
MAVVAYIEINDGIIKKGSLEAASFAAKLAQEKGTKAVAVVIGKGGDTSVLGKYGIAEALHYNLEDTQINSLTVAQILHAEAQNLGATEAVFSGSWIAKAAAASLAVHAQMGIVTEVTELPKNGTILKKAFSNKAFVKVELQNSKNCYVISANSFGLHENQVNTNVQEKTSSSSSGLNHVSYNKDTSKVSLTDAELVVSAGRGLKAPENWHLVEELAKVLGAGTACSKPVSDAGWRPHHEHVGQTGISISPNLYIAIGISGAIQHLAGVSSSKNIVAINSDPEAPFFKAADYGIVGDAFDILPKLTEALRKAKG